MVPWARLQRAYQEVKIEKELMNRKLNDERELSLKSDYNLIIISNYWFDNIKLLIPFANVILVTI